jgi:hypothetical protein
VVPVARSTVRELTDRLLDGNLDAWLAEQKDAGHSFAEIAFRLRTEHQVIVTGETVRAWYKDSAQMGGDAA